MADDDGEPPVEAGDALADMVASGDAFAAADSDANTLSAAVSQIIAGNSGDPMHFARAMQSVMAQMQQSSAAETAVAADAVAAKVIAALSSKLDNKSVVTTPVATATPATAAAATPADTKKEKEDKKSGNVASTVSASRSSAAGVEEDDGTECPICKGPIHAAVVPQCQHAVCSACATRLCKDANPRCPSCRAAVHRDGYARSPAIDKMVAALHPAAPRPAAPAVAAPESAQSLQQWNAVKLEHGINAAIKQIWSEIKKVSLTGDALMLGRDSPEVFATQAANHVHMPNGMCCRMTEQQQDTWNALWRCKAKVATKLRQSGLQVLLFTHRNEEHILIRWAVPAAAAPAAVPGSSV